MSYFTHEKYFCHEKNGVLSTSIQQHETMKAEALKLIENGFSIIPLNHPLSESQCSCSKNDCRSIGKHPLTKNGVKDASSDRHIVMQWWDKFPYANIGIATGKEVGICVLDIDSKHGGFQSLAILEAKNGALPVSTRVQTGGSGLHIYFRTERQCFKNHVNLVKGIDFRGDGGYVVAPPSLHASGERYRWIHRSAIELVPDWLRMLLEGGTKRVENEYYIFSEGQRNQSLTSIAGYLRTKGIDNQQLETILETVNQTVCSPLLDELEVKSIARSISKYQTPVWSKATPLPKNVFSVESLKTEHIPCSLRIWVEDIAERMQVPLEFIMAPALVGLGSIIGRKIGIRPLQHDDWTVVPNLWGFLVAEPGSMKSPAMMAALKPLEALQTEAKNKFVKNCQEVQKDERSLQREIEAIREALKVDLRSGFVSDLASKRKILGELEEKQVQKKHVIEKRYKTNDPTVEKLALILQENPQGILLIRDELSGWLESLHKNGREGNREFYLEAWNGTNSYTIDRIGRGTTHVDALCVSIFGGIQPDKLEKYINKTTSRDGDDGFLERFQIVFYPDRRKSWQLIDRVPNKKAEESVCAVWKRLDQISGCTDTQQFLRFSLHAQEIADEWRTQLEKRLLEEDLSPIVKSHLSKYRSLMPSLALIFALTANEMPPSIDQESTNIAIEWCRILESHIRLIYQRTSHDSLYGARVLAQKIKAQQVNDHDKLRDICRHNWQALKTAEQLDNAIESLSAFGWVKIQTVHTIGGKSEIIRINPHLPEEVDHE